MIKVVSFDIGGTLIKNSNNYKMDDLARIVNKDKEEVAKAYRDIFQKRRGSFDELVNLFCKKLNVQENDEIRLFFTNVFNQDGYFDENNLPVIKKLKELGYKVILFSNTSNLYINKINDEVKKLVDGIFYSYEMGYTKDEKEAYRYIEDKLGYHANEFLHVGDSINNDYYYPKENGWNAVFYGKDNTIKCISDLKEIISVVRNIDN